MEFSISLDPETGIYTITINGLIDTNPIRESVYRLVGSPDWRDGSNIIVDHRNSAALSLSSRDQAQMASLFSSLQTQLAGSRIALVMRETSQFFLAQMWQLALSRETSFEARIFLDLDKARRWISRSDLASQEAQN